MTRRKCYLGLSCAFGDPRSKDLVGTSCSLNAVPTKPSFLPCLESPIWNMKLNSSVYNISVVPSALRIKLRFLTSHQRPPELAYFQTHFPSFSPSCFMTGDPKLLCSPLTLRDCRFCHVHACLFLPRRPFPSSAPPNPSSMSISLLCSSSCCIFSS